jgi:predicted dehydrogenase
MKSSLAADSAVDSKIRIGYFGCGGRGTWLAKLFMQHGGYEIVSAADYFEDRMKKFQAEVRLPDVKMYPGLSGYKRLLDAGGIDAVVIETPPYFHPEHAAAGVEAGCHVYLAKPIAVDVLGCKSIKASGEAAQAKHLAFLIDFQTRSQPLFVEALRRVHGGALGQMCFGESSYQCEEYFKEKYEDWWNRGDNPENALRAWQLSRELSGDIIVEQNIHTLDVMSWIMGDKPPTKVTGTGGMKARKNVGIYDHFALVYEYPNNVGVAFDSCQMDAYGSPEGIKNRMFGTEGVIETEYGGQVIIRGRGENFYRGGQTTDIYKEGAVNNIKTFYDDVTSGNLTYPTLEPSVLSNLVSIMGRMAAYTHESVTWDKLMASDEKYVFDTTGLKD